MNSLKASLEQKDRAKAIMAIFSCSKIRMQRNLIEKMNGKEDIWAIDRYLKLEFSRRFNWNIHDSREVAVYDKGSILLIFPLQDREDLVSISIRGKNIEINMESNPDVVYTRVLFKICATFSNMLIPVTINKITLKAGEHLAALIYQLSGDKAGYLATLDEAMDRA